MYQKALLALTRWVDPASASRQADVGAGATTRSFNLLRWFSILSFLAVTAISIGFAAVLSHFLTREMLQRDAVLTNQFVSSIVTAENQQARLGNRVTLGQILDERADFAGLGVEPRAASAWRTHFYDHLRLMPDVLLVNVFAADRTIIWATNPGIIGKINTGNEELEEAFESRAMVATDYLNQEHHNEHQHKEEQAFNDDPQRFFVEEYMPLLDSSGNVVAVVEIYKEPQSLLDAIQRGNQLVWACTVFGMVFLYLALFWIIRRADMTLEYQQRRLLDQETLCVVGENDIIAQVDRLGKWVRDLLVFSRPVAGENQAIDVVSLVDDCLPNFAAQLAKNRVSCSFVRPSVPVPRVIGNRALATQALGSVISNAIEAMPGGGSLRLELNVAAPEHRVDVIVTDTGPGMSATQMDLVFKPFYTTKRNGLGLGMALVKRIMERFGGAIRLNSREGEGTRVSLSFNVD